MLKACKQVKRVMEDNTVQDATVQAALISLQNEAISCPTAPEDAERMEIIKDLAFADGYMVFNALTYLLEPSAQLATLSFAAQKTQRVLFRAACSQHLAKKACQLIAELLENADDNFKQQQSNTERIAALRYRLAQLIELRRQGVVSTSYQQKDDDIDIGAPRVFSQSPEKSEISCALSESSQAEKRDDLSVEEQIVACKTEIAELQSDSTDLRVEKNELRKRLDTILQYFTNVLLSQADEQATGFFANFIVQSCSFLGIMEMLFFFAQNGYDIGSHLMIIAAALSARDFAVRIEPFDPKAVASELWQVKPQKFTFYLESKTVRIDERAEARYSTAGELRRTKMAPIPRFSSILPSHVRKMSYRYDSAHVFQMHRQQKVSLVDKVIGGARMEPNAKRKQKGTAPMSLPVSALKLSFSYLRNPLNLLKMHQDKFFSTDLSLFLAGIAPTLRTQATSFYSIYQSRFQQIASCYVNFDLHAQQIQLSYRFSYVGLVASFLHYFCEGMHRVCASDFDSVSACIRSAHEQCMELLEVLKQQSGELKQQAYVYDCYRSMTFEFLNYLARFCLQCRKMALFLMEKLQKDTQLYISQEDLISYNRNNGNPMGLQFEIVERRLYDLKERVSETGRIHLVFQKYYELSVDCFCSSRAIFLLNPTLQHFYLVKTRELQMTAEYFCMLQFAVCLHYALDSERIYVLQEGVREARQRVDDASMADDSGFEDELESFEVDSTADLIFLHLFFGGKIVHYLIQMTERAVFGPIFDKEDCLDVVRYIFEFIRLHDGEFHSILTQACSLEAYIVFTKFFEANEPLDLSYFVKLFSEFVGRNQQQFREDVEYEHFLGLFIPKSVRFSYLEEQCTRKLAELRKTRVEAENVRYRDSAAVELAYQRENYSNIPDLSSVLDTPEAAAENLSELSLLDDFAYDQDEVLLANYSRFVLSDQSHEIAASRVSELLNFAFDYQQITGRVKRLHQLGRFSQFELDYLTRSSTYSAQQLCELLLCDERTLRKAQERAGPLASTNNENE